VQSQQLLPKGEVLKEEFSSRVKGGDKPAEQMSKGHKHRVIIAKSAQARVRLEVIDSADVQSLGEALTCSSLYSTVSRPFDKPETGKIAVKVINHCGDEVLKVFEI